MTIFLLFLLFVFFGGIYLRHLSPARRALLVVVVSLLLALIYFSLERFI